MARLAPKGFGTSCADATMAPVVPTSMIFVNCASATTANPDEAEAPAEGGAGTELDAGVASRADVAAEAPALGGAAPELGAAHDESTTAIAAARTGRMTLQRPACELVTATATLSPWPKRLLPRAPSRFAGI